MTAVAGSCIPPRRPQHLLKFYSIQPHMSIGNPVPLIVRKYPTTIEGNTPLEVEPFDNRMTAYRVSTQYDPVRNHIATMATGQQQLVMYDGQVIQPEP